MGTLSPRTITLHGHALSFIDSGSGPAVLFAKVKGSRLPVVANLLANERRICLALDVASLDEIASRLSEPLAGATSGGWMDALRLFPATASGQRFQPRQIKNAPAQQVVRLASDVDLTELPIPSDTGARGAAAVRIMPEQPHAKHRNKRAR